MTKLGPDDPRSRLPRCPYTLDFLRDHYPPETPLYLLKLCTCPPCTTVTGCLAHPLAGFEPRMT